MSDNTKVSELLAAALQGAADVARARLGRDVSIVPVDGVESSAILRFDLTFASGGRLAWFVANDDATGFSDMLIGGSGDRSVVLTEMHLDALTVAFSDMLTRTVEGIGSGLDTPVEAGELDLGMEPELPEADPAGVRVLLALDVAGFGPIPIVQQADADLAHFLEQHTVADLSVVTAAVASATAAAPAVAQPAPAGPDAAAGDAAEAGHVDNVVPLPAQAAAAPSAATARDLDLLMNVPLPLTVELGSTQRTIRELVDFSIGSIIELGKLAGDPLDIKVNDRVIARGEVVVIDEEFGIRVTEIVSPEDRLRGLA